MSQLYGHRWTSAYGDSDQGNVWLACLQGLTLEQVQDGARVMARSGEAWPPTAPEFRHLCEQVTAERFGLPGVREALREVMEKSHSPMRATWSHPAVYEAGRETGWFDIRNSSTRNEIKRIEDRFARLYEAVCHRVMAGEVITLPKSDPTRLEHHSSGKKVMTEEAKARGRRTLEALKKRMGV